MTSSSIPTGLVAIALLQHQYPHQSYSPDRKLDIWVAPPKAVRPKTANDRLLAYAAVIRRLYLLIILLILTAPLLPHLRAMAVLQRPRLYPRLA